MPWRFGGAGPLLEPTVAFEAVNGVDLDPVTGGLELTVPQVDYLAAVVVRYE